MAKIIQIQILGSNLKKGRFKNAYMLHLPKNVKMCNFTKLCMIMSQEKLDFRTQDCTKRVKMNNLNKAVDYRIVFCPE